MTPTLNNPKAHAEPSFVPWRADHHMHIKSRAAVDALIVMCASFGEDPPPNAAPSLGTAAVAALEQVRAQRGVLLSQAYFFGSPYAASAHYDVPHMTRAENEYVAEQVLTYPDRLVGFFSVNPLSSNAPDEVRHWARDGRLKGMKLHLSNSVVRFEDSEHVRQLGAVVRLAGEAKLPMVIHLSTTSRFTAQETEIFIRDVLPCAGDAWVQIAHGAGFGGTEQAMLEPIRVFARHIERNNAVTRNVVFDLSEVVTPRTTEESAGSFVAAMRKIGVSRFLPGCDWDLNQPKESDELMRRKFHVLSQDEWQTVAGNCAPWACEQ